MPTIIFGAMCIISSLLVFLLPETNNTRLPDTIEEAERFFKKKKSKTDTEKENTFD